jgi:hypothetical protein
MTAAAAGITAASARVRIQGWLRRCPSAWSSDRAPGPVRARAAVLAPRTAGNSNPPLLAKKPLGAFIEEATIIGI